MLALPTAKTNSKLYIKTWYLSYHWTIEENKNKVETSFVLETMLKG